MRQDILEAGSEWMVKHRGTDDPKVLVKIADRVEELLEEQGGYPSVSHFERSYLELVSSGEIPKITGTFGSQKQSAFDQEFLTYIERTSAFEQSRRYKSDPEFRRKYDEYQRAKPRNYRRRQLVAR